MPRHTNEDVHIELASAASGGLDVPHPAPR